MVPLGSKDKAWFMRWLRKLDPDAFRRHQEKDPNWTYATPKTLALFMDSKRQFVKNFRGAVNYAVDSSGNRRPDEALSGATRYVTAMMIVWQKCDKYGAAAWLTAPQNSGALRLPRNYDRSISWIRYLRYGRDQITASFRDPTGKDSSYNGDTRYTDSIKRLSCPDADMQKLLWNRPTADERIKDVTLLANYVRAKSRRLAQVAANAQQRMATQQGLLREARQNARAAAMKARTQAQTVAALQSELSQKTAELDQAREQAAQGVPVSNEALDAMQSDVTDLTLELSEANEEFSEAQYEADMAEETFGIEYEVYAETDPTLPPEVPGLDEELPLDPTLMDVPPLDPTMFEPLPEEISMLDEPLTAPAEEAQPSFLQQYKWHLLGGGVVVVGAWYYFTKYKPAQEAAALTANLADRRAALYALAENLDQDLF